MSLVDVISTFDNSASYTVTRTVKGTYTKGRYTAGGTSTFSVTGSLQPMDEGDEGRELQVLPEGQHARNLRRFYTTTELFTLTPTNDPDTISIDGETWEVLRVERWQFVGTTHYKVIFSRVALP